MTDFDDVIKPNYSILAANGDHIQLGVVPHAPNGTSTSIERGSGLKMDCQKKTNLSENRYIAVAE